MSLLDRLKSRKNMGASRVDNSTPAASSIQPKSERKDVKSMVDKSHPFTMIYSGVEQEKYFNVLYNMGVRDFLMSYHYLSKAGARNMHKYHDMGIRLFIDSGGYTYRTNDEYADYTEEQWESLIVKYLNWARKHKDIIFAIADFDLQGLVPCETVYRWRREYFEPFMLETGVPVCFVWHPEDGTEYWTKMCQRYGYIGTSAASDAETKQVMSRFMREAQKYDTLVHGFGLTQTKELTTLPMFTVDSTTYLVGLQYGEVNYWDGKAMHRLKKDKWKGEYLNNLVNKCGVDRDKLLEEDVETLLKVNVHAFIEAEEYIRHRLKSRMYWLRPKAVKMTEDEVYDMLPDESWIFDSPKDDWEEVAKKLNVSTEDKDTAIMCISDAAYFIKYQYEGNEDFDSNYTDDTINSLHDEYVNRVCNSIDEKREDLKKFYLECLMGESDRLLVLGTNFNTKSKEREYYIEEQTEENIDISEEEVLERLSSSNLLPESATGAPELDELEDEIFRDAGVNPVRDEMGRFVKGQVTVHRQKNLYSDKYPKLACDTCFAGQTCPEYKSGFVCAYNKMFKRFSSRNMGDIIEAMQGMADVNLERLQKAILFETLNGGVPTGMVSSLMDQSMRQLINLQSMYLNGGREVAKYTKTVREDGSVTETVSTSSTNPQSGGIMEMLFKSLNNSSDKEEDINDIVETTAEEVNPEPKLEKTEDGEIKVILDTDD